MLVNELAGETAFPQAGERYLIKFRTKDIMVLHAKYGPDPRKEPKRDDKGNLVDHFWTVITRGLDVCDAGIVMDCLKLGLKVRTVDERLLLAAAPDDEFWDDLPFSFEEAAPALSSGIMWSRWGKSPEQVAAWMQEQATLAQQEAAAGAGEDPTTPIGTATSPSASPGSDTAAA